MTDETMTTADELCELEDFLKSYKLSSTLLKLQKYEREFFAEQVWEAERPGELALARARMFEVRSFIMGLKNSNEKILLYLHYVDCEPVERCSYIMNISRSSAFRLKKKALRYALPFFSKLKAEKAIGSA